MGRFQGNYQGRGRSSRGGRSGRGQGRNNRNGNKKTNSREIKFAPHASHTRGGYATFDTVLKSVITKVSESVTEYSQDILKSLETMNYVDFDDSEIKPKKDIAVSVTRATDSAETKEKKEKERKELQDENDEVYREAIREWTKRKRVHDHNKRKAYDIIISFCAASMKTRLEDHPDYEKNVGDPILTGIHARRPLTFLTHLEK